MESDEPPPVTVEPFVAVRPRSLPPDSPPPLSRVWRRDETGIELGGVHGAARGAPHRESTLVAAGARATDFGPLTSLTADPAVTDVFVNGPGQVWVDRGSGLVRAPSLRLDEDGLRDLAVRLVAAGGRHIDEASPCVDTRLDDGIRVHAVLPPISPAGTLLSIRIPHATGLSVAELDRDGYFDVVSRASVCALVARRANVLITGAAGSGKSTLLSALLGEAEATERIIAIEDVAELRVRHPHFIALEARQANLEGAGALGLATLLREALRMRPDRLVLGECRGAEIRELLGALNTGHDGGAGTLHANSLEDVPARLEALGALAGLSAEATARQAVSAIGAVLHVERAGGQRRLAQAGRLALDASGRLTVIPAATGQQLMPGAAAASAAEES